MFIFENSPSIFIFNHPMYSIPMHSNANEQYFLFKKEERGGCISFIASYDTLFAILASAIELMSGISNYHLK